jgi:hypothetical protein
MSLVGMSITPTGSNADIADPLGAAIRECGGVVQDITIIVDQDVQSIPQQDTNKLLDFAELRLLETITGNLTLTTITVGDRSESLSDLSRGLATAISMKSKSITDRYGLGAIATSGVIALDFAEKEDLP